MIRLFYTSKFLTIILWATGFYSYMLVAWLLDREEYSVTANSIPVAFGIALDLYFTYCIYSCYHLGLRGSFSVQPSLGVNQIEAFTVRKAENVVSSPVFQCENIKEITAYPESQFLCKDIKQSYQHMIGDFTVIEKNPMVQVELS
jgi:hypothetical protein